MTEITVNVLPKNCHTCKHSKNFKHLHGLKDYQGECQLTESQIFNYEKCDKWEGRE